MNINTVDILIDGVITCQQQAVYFRIKSQCSGSGNSSSAIAAFFVPDASPPHYLQYLL
jgi:hypothetical protein